MNQKAYFSHIDSLRAFAVLGVIIYHLNPYWLSGGFAGVDIFFVISGFVVTAANPFGGNGHFKFLSTFYAKRFARIVPALILTLVLTALFAALFIPGEAEVQAFKQIIRGSFFAHANWVLIAESTNYFSPLAEFNLFTHTWSLSVEEQFYFLFPLIIFVLATRKKAIAYQLLGFGLVALASLAWLSWEGDRVVAFYSLATRFWEVALGVVTYKATQLEYRPLGMLKVFKIMGSMPLILLILTGFYFGSSAKFPDIWLLSLTFGTGLILYLEGVGEIKGAASKLLLNPQLRFIGKISYSLYLFHWPVSVLLKWTIGLHSPAGYTIAILATFSLSIVSYYIVEKPILVGRKRLNIPNFATIGIGIIALVGAYWLSINILGSQNRLSLSKVIQDKTNWESNFQDFVSEKCEILETTLAKGEAIISRKGDCRGTGSGPRVFVVGDSHVHSYLSLFRKLVFNHGNEVHLISKPGCPLITLLPTNSESCAHFISDSIDHISRIGAVGDIVFLPGLRLARLSNRLQILSRSDERTITVQEKEKAVVDSLRHLAPLLEKDIWVVLESPKPLLNASPFRCSDWFNKNNPHCEGLVVDRNEQLEYREEIVKLFFEMSKNSHLIQVWDPFSKLCPEGSEGLCKAWYKGKPLYYDSDHISSFGSLYLYDSFFSFISNGLVQLVN